jgi:hypothetical protein
MLLPCEPGARLGSGERERVMRKGSDTRVLAPIVENSCHMHMMS